MTVFGGVSKIGGRSSRTGVFDNDPLARTAKTLSEYRRGGRRISATEAFDDGHANLGRLKGNRGDQDYVIPAGTDLERVPVARHLVIWCDRFNSAFGAADLTAVERRLGA